MRGRGKCSVDNSELVRSGVRPKEMLKRPIQSVEAVLTFIDANHHYLLRHCPIPTKRLREGLFGCVERKPLSHSNAEKFFKAIWEWEGRLGSKKSVLGGHSVVEKSAEDGKSFWWKNGRIVRNCPEVSSCGGIGMLKQSFKSYFHL